MESPPPQLHGGGLHQPGAGLDPDIMMALQNIKEKTKKEEQQKSKETIASDVLFSLYGQNFLKALTKNAKELKVGDEDDCIPCNGRWNFNDKTLCEPTTIECWAIVNFSAHCVTSHLPQELINCRMRKGININRPHALIDEDRCWIGSGPVIRVERMFEMVMLSLPGPPQFLLRVLQWRKNSDMDGLWKMKNLSNFGIVTHCIAPTRINDQYLTNVLLKINSKVVGSRQWPLISRCQADVRTLSPKLEMIVCPYKPQANRSDDVNIRELLMDFCETGRGRKPEQVIVFRDGVIESLNIELNQICKVPYVGRRPFTVERETKTAHSPKLGKMRCQKAPVAAFFIFLLFLLPSAVFCGETDEQRLLTFEDKLLQQAEIILERELQEFAKSSQKMIQHMLATSEKKHGFGKLNDQFIFVSAVVSVVYFLIAIIRMAIESKKAIKEWWQYCSFWGLR